MDRFEERVRRFGAGERSEFRRILDSVDGAQRVAKRLDNLDRSDPARMPKPGEVGRLPGTGNRGGEVYTYTVRIRTADRSGDGRNSFLVVIEDANILPGSEIRARAIQSVEQGTASTRVSYRTANPMMILPESVEVISVYRGSLNV